MKNILLFGDPGIDDTLAIIYALLHPEINLIGIVCGYGNVSRKQTIQNTFYLLSLAERLDIPIIGGATRSLTGDVDDYYPEIHGPDGLGPIHPPEGLPSTLNNFSTIYEVISRYHDVTIVDVGRQTSLAAAYILDSTIMNSVKEVFMMGGAFLVPGNVTPTAEANFHGDPVAVNAVLANAPHVTITPLNVTNFAIIAPQDIRYITEHSSFAFTHLLEPIHNYYFKAYQKLVPGIKGTPMHDVFTLWALMNPDKVRSVRRKVFVETNLSDKGLSIADFRPLSSHEQTGKQQNIILQFDYSAFVADFIRVMSGASSI
ncbi:nucleoside hydrolase [Fictibacillus aquaticus]|uniref:nucleoside hydrolase n=1 Tax=Fictibacillus aquaticus TaxID=2021314 RepID=UPI001054174E|nr:nucleoside hydrolase [Fictibacillus aquaticus]